MFGGSVRLYKIMRLFYWHLHYIYDLIYVHVLYCVFTGIF